MNKTTLTVAVLVAVGIMLGAAGFVAGMDMPIMDGQMLAGPGSSPAPGAEENPKLIDEIMNAVADEGGQTTRAEVAAAIGQAKAMGADLDSTTVKTSADFDKNEMACCGIHECQWHCWVWVCPPIHETHAALLWNECTNSDLDLYICNSGGYAVSNAAHTLTEEVAVTGCGVNYIWVHGTKVAPYSSYQPYMLAVDCELPKMCRKPCN